MVLVLLLVAGVVAGNNVVEGRELNRLLARVVASQDAIAYSDRRVAATVEYTRPLLFGANVPPNVRAGLQQLVADAAAGQVGAIDNERADAAKVSLLPWHRGLQKAKTALVAYLTARVAYMRGVATDTAALYVAHPELTDLRDDARDALREAAGGGAQKRVDAAFARRTG